MENVISYIKEQIGVELTPCDHFTGIKKLHGRKYFNAILKERCSESKDFDKLLFYQEKLGIKVEQCGLNRVSIFF